jgi:hypothetical protein
MRIGYSYYTDSYTIIKIQFKLSWVIREVVVTISTELNCRVAVTRVGISARTPATLTEVFSDLPQTLLQMLG